MSAALDPALLARLAVEACSAAGASYADARVGRIQREELGLRNGTVGSADAPEEFGIGVRVVAGGTWGFAAASLCWRE
ncbi:MAG: PmbA/TldA family metallopeptidase, partial [Planctomycetota bacterium]